MAERATDLVEKVPAPPLVQDTTTPELSSDDDTPEGHIVACTGEPNEADILVWDNAARKWRPTNPGDIGVGLEPVTIDDGMGGFDIVFDEDGNVVYS